MSAQGRPEFELRQPGDAVWRKALCISTKIERLALADADRVPSDGEHGVPLAMQAQQLVAGHLSYSCMLASTAVFWL